MLTFRISQNHSMLCRKLMVIMEIKVGNFCLFCPLCQIPFFYIPTKQKLRPISKVETFFFPNRSQQYV